MARATRPLKPRPWPWPWPWPWSFAGKEEEGAGIEDNLCGSDVPKVGKIILFDFTTAFAAVSGRREGVWPCRRECRRMKTDFKVRTFFIVALRLPFTLLTFFTSPAVFQSSWHSIPQRESVLHPGWHLPAVACRQPRHCIRPRKVRDTTSYAP